MNNRPLSVHDFKNWLFEQKDLNDFFNIGRDEEDPNERFVGKEVKPKVSEKKIMTRMETEEDAEVLTREFLEEGGVILAVDEKKFQVEVESGTFFIPQFCVKVRKDK